MGFREVSVVEVREVLRGWLEGAGLRKAAERAGVDRKTARRYVAAAEAEGLTRDAGVEALSDELIGGVVAAVRPARPNGHGAAWERLLATTSRPPGHTSSKRPLDTRRTWDVCRGQGSNCRCKRVLACVHLTHGWTVVA